MGLPDILKQGDVKLYKSWAERLGVSVDQSWCLQTEKEASVLKERLDADLNAAKTSLMKEEIRAAHAAMGDLYYNRNDLNSAFKVSLFFVSLRVVSQLAWRSATCGRETIARALPTFWTCVSR